MRTLFNAKGECTSAYACYYGDWTIDKFFKTCQNVKPLPIKGVHVGQNATEQERFCIELKTAFKDFCAKWDGSLEDLFKSFSCDYNFSDWYKEVFNQRPHLPVEFYLYAMGYESVGGIRFCMPPFKNDVDDAVWSAKAYRQYLHEKAV